DFSLQLLAPILHHVCCAGSAARERTLSCRGHGKVLLTSTFGLPIPPATKGGAAGPHPAAGFAARQSRLSARSGDHGDPAGEGLASRQLLLMPIAPGLGLR